MSNDGLEFDDFDLDMQFNGVSRNNSKVATAIRCLITNGGTFNSSTSVCCATATNVTESCSWCNGCH